MAWRAVPLSNSSIVFSAIACGSSKGTSTPRWSADRSEEHTSELQSLAYLVCRLLLEKKKGTCEYSSRSRNGSDASVNSRNRSTFFFNDTATTEIYTLSLHDALPIIRWSAD